MTIIFPSGTVAPTRTFLIVTVMLAPNNPTMAKSFLAFVTAESFAVTLLRAGVKSEVTGQTERSSFLLC